MPPRMHCPDIDTCTSIDLALMQIVAERQNASISLIWVDTFSTTWVMDAYKLLLNADLTLITSLKLNVKQFTWKSINAYDETAFCALVPIPKRLSFLEFMLKPFDWATWLAILSSVITSALLWKFLSKHSNSAFRFIAAIIADFFGQSIELKSDRHLQILLLKMCLIMSFILGNSYQSLIIAFMMTSREGRRIKTFEELFETEIPLIVDHLVKGFFLLDGHKQALRMRVIGMIRVDNFVFRNFSYITRCDTIDFILESKEEFASNMYKLPESMLKSPETFFLRPMSPQQKTIQDFFDKFHESGIRQYWTSRLQSQKLFALGENKKVENDLLIIDDFAGLFYFLFASHVFSTLVLMLELTYRCLKFRSIIKMFENAKNKLHCKNATT